VLELCLFKPLTESQTHWMEKAAETMANALRFALESDERREAEERVKRTYEFERRIAYLVSRAQFIHAMTRL